MNVNIDLKYNEAQILFSLLKREIEAIMDCNLNVSDRNYILNDYSTLLKKIEDVKCNLSEYDET